MSHSSFDRFWYSRAQCFSVLDTMGFVAFVTHGLSVGGEGMGWAGVGGL